MKLKSLYLPLTTCLVLMGVAAIPVEEKATVRKQFSPLNPGAPMSLLIDNIWGGISVSTHAGPNIEVVVNKRLVAPSEQTARELADKVKLDISQTENHVRFYVDGPFREHNRVNRSDDWDMKDTKLVCDYQVVVPASTRLELKTVVEGDITVTGAAAEFDVQVVTGRAKLSGIKGFGRVSAITKDLTVDFDRKPSQACYFRNISGDVKVSFPEDLSADLYFKTFQGEIFTDFPVTRLPAVPVKRESKNGKFIYKVNEFYRVRVGKGGPELKFDTLTGDIEIHDRALRSIAEREQ